MTNNSARDMDFYNSLWYYKNTSTTVTPNYSFVQNDFLQAQTIDIGERSHPLFWDIDADGDEDLLLTSWGLLDGTQFKSKVFLYDNLGNNTFKIVDDDYLGFAQYNYYALKLTKGDLNGDGAIDLLYARTENGGVSSRIMAVYNQNNVNNSVAFDIANSFSVGINSITSDAPFLYDLDIDGDNDLLVGALSGKLFYYNNTGDNVSFNFNLVTDTLGGIKNNSLRSMTVPYVANLDGNNKPELIIGNNSGMVRVYTDFTNNLNGNFTNYYDLIVKNSINNTLFQPKLGKFISPYIFDYNGDSQPDLFCGTYGGGIVAFENITSVINKSTNLLSTSVFKIFPNPASDKLYVETSENGFIYIKTFDGKLLSENSTINNSGIDISQIKNGVYIVEFKSKNSNHFQKLVISK